MIMTNDPVLLAILAERNNQKKEHSKESDEKHSASDWIAIISRHLGMSINDGGSVEIERFKRQMVRVAAIAMAAVQTVEGRTAPKEKTAGKHEVTGTGW